MKRLGIILLVSTLFLLLTNNLIAAKKKQKDKIQLQVDESVEDKMSQEELDMKPYKVETEDGYLLTLFHITSTNKIVAETMIKGAVLLHHGTSMDG